MPRPGDKAISCFISKYLMPSHPSLPKRSPSRTQRMGEGRKGVSWPSHFSLLKQTILVETPAGENNAGGSCPSPATPPYLASKPRSNPPIPTSTAGLLKGNRFLQKPTFPAGHLSRGGAPLRPRSTEYHTRDIRFSKKKKIYTLFPRVSLYIPSRGSHVPEATCPRSGAEGKRRGIEAGLN